jgi:hypothetical protein
MAFIGTSRLIAPNLGMALSAKRRLSTAIRVFERQGEFAMTTRSTSMPAILALL